MASDRPFLQSADRKLATAGKLLEFDEEGSLQQATARQQTRPALTLFDHLRRKRNLALYDDISFVSHHDAKEALQTARTYVGILRADIDGRRPASCNRDG